MFLLAEFVILDAAVPAWAWVGLVALAWLFVVSAAAGMTLWLLARRQASRAMKRSLIMVVLLGVVLLVAVVATIVRELQDGIVTALAPRLDQRDAASGVEGEFPDDESILALFEEGAPAYSAEEAEAWVDELVPLVEEFAERRFRVKPDVRVGDRGALIDALTRNLYAQLRRQMPYADEDEVWSLVGWQASILAPAMLGVYDQEQRVVHLAPTNVDPVMRFAEVDPRHLEPIVKIIIAHELTHALQDQQVDLRARLLNLEDPQEVEAFSATIEGHAVFIADRVGERLGLDAGRLELARLLSAGALGAESSPSFIRMVELVFERRYLGGRDFITYHFAQGGSDRVWEILARPPRRMSTILTPASYGRPRRGPGDYASVLRGLESYFGDQPWTVTSETAYFEHPVPDYQAVSPEDLLDYATFVEDIRVLKLRDPKTGSDAVVTLFVLAGSEFTPRLAEMREAWMRRAVEDRQHSRVTKVWGVVIGDLRGIDAPVARVVSYRQMMRDGANRTYQYKMALIGRDNLLVEVTASRMDLPDSSIIKLAEEAFRRCREIEVERNSPAAGKTRHDPVDPPLPSRQH